MTIDQIIQQSLDAHKEGRLEEAEKLYLTVLQTHPLHATTNHNLGVIALSMNKIEFAIPFFKTAIEVNPNIEHFWISYINALIKKNDFSEAEENSKKAITLNPSFITVQNIFANMLLTLERLDESEKYFRQVMQLNPNSAEAHNNLGVVLQALNNENEAEISFKHAIRLKSDFADAHYNLGILLNKMWRGNEADSSIDNARKLNPDINYLLGFSLHIKMVNCKWDNLPADLNEIKKKINDGKKVATPFPMLSLIDDPSIHRKSAEIYLNDKYSKSYVFPKISPYHGHKKIKIGYYSPNFNNHPVAYLTAELYEIHDRKKFEIHAFSFGGDTEDEFNIRIKEGVDHFHNVQMMSNDDVVKLSRSLEIDIAIDLAGYTDRNRTNIFAMSVAPIQVNYLGYTGTMGSNYHDYYIADRNIITEQNKKYSSEKIVYMPNSYLVDISKKDVSETTLFRHEVGLPDVGFVFCCFNNSWKFTPSVFASWMKILKATDGSVLWLLVSSIDAKKNLKDQAKKLGINEERLIFATRMTGDKHLKRIQLADLFLDTLPYNAHITASDALRVGLPVLTCTGHSFAARVATSLLKTVNVPELITTTQEEYESLAVELAKHPKKLKIIKNKLINNLSTSPLYDSKLFTSHLETAYLIMYERYKNGLNPDNIKIKH